MTVARQLKLLLTLLALLALVGCASGGAGRGPSDEEQIVALLDGMLSALQAEDIEGMAVYYADDFSGTQGDKAATTQFLTMVRDQGFFAGVEVDQTGRTIEIDGEQASVNGISLAGMFGVLAVGFELEKRDGEWIVVAQTQE